MQHLGFNNRRNKSKVKNVIYISNILLEGILITVVYLSKLLKSYTSLYSIIFNNDALVFFLFTIFLTKLIKLILTSKMLYVWQ